VAFKLALAWQGLLLRGWDQSRHVAWWETLRGFALRDHWSLVSHLYIFACMRPDLHVSTEVGFMYIYILYVWTVCRWWTIHRTIFYLATIINPIN
jgi:hypothetical protein